MVLMSQRIYVASSWRNKYQPDVVVALRDAGHDVYDFKNPAEGDHGFSWKETNPDWTPDKYPTVEQYKAMLSHPTARRGFDFDFAALNWATLGVLVLPSGRSAHLEAGYLLGRDVPVAVFAPEPVEPELMYLVAGDFPISGTLDEVLDRVSELSGLNP